MVWRRGAQFPARCVFLPPAPSHPSALAGSGCYSPLLLICRESWLDAHNKSSLQDPCPSPVSNRGVLDLRAQTEANPSLITGNVLHVIRHCKQRGCCVSVFLLFIYFFYVGSGGEGGGQRYETRVFMPPAFPVICDWPRAQFHLYERPCNCDRNFPNEVSMEDHSAVFSVKAEFDSLWSQDISG